MNIEKILTRNFFCYDFEEWNDVDEVRGLLACIDIDPYWVKDKQGNLAAYILASTNNDKKIIYCTPETYQNVLNADLTILRQKNVELELAKTELLQELITVATNIDENSGWCHENVSNSARELINRYI